jgi:hypothetical protein
VKAAIGVLLIALGVAGLAYGGFTYVYDDPIDIGPIHTSIEREKTLPVPPIVGGASLVAGVALLLWNGKKS